jgi:hypothetical protein
MLDHGVTFGDLLIIAGIIAGFKIGWRAPDWVRDFRRGRDLARRAFRDQNGRTP